MCRMPTHLKEHVIYMLNEQWPVTRARELCRPADILRHMFLLDTLDEFVANQTPILNVDFTRDIKIH